MTDEAETQAVGAGRRLTRSPLFGIGLALLGALIITPDTLLIRLSGRRAGADSVAWIADRWLHAAGLDDHGRTADGR